MSKKSLVFIVLSFFSISFIIPEFKNSWVEKGLKGKVKKVTERCYKIKSIAGKNKKKLWYWVTYEYDSLGNEILKKEKDNDGSEDTTVDQHSYQYDAKGDVVEVNGAVQIKYKYDDSGRKMQELEYSNGILFYRSIYRYDNRGDMIEQDFYKDGGPLSDKMLFKYDDKGNIIEREYYEPLDTLAFRNVFKYDDKGNEIEYYNHFVIGGDDRSMKDFNEFGDQTEFKSYNGRGKLMQETEYSYEYDKKGNWTKENDFKKGNCFQVSERIIEYYQ